jgi:uncharacterized protein
MMEATLVLVCKRPILGIGKQRLAASLGVEMTQRVAKALLTCAVEDASNWSGPVVIAPADPLDYQWAQTLSAPIPSPVTILPQVFGNLGQRLNALDQTLRRKKMEQLVFIGSDAPGLNETDYVAVKESLQCHDTVLIPAVDGGVVLMASRIEWPELSDLPWSTNQLSVSLVKSCRTAGYYVTKLQQGYDIDEPDDLVKLTEKLASDRRPARQALYQLVCSIVSATHTVNA